MAPANLYKFAITPKRSVTPQISTLELIMMHIFYKKNRTARKFIHYKKSTDIYIYILIDHSHSKIENCYTQRRQQHNYEVCIELYLIVRRLAWILIASNIVNLYRLTGHNLLSFTQHGYL